ncbi:MAG: hypothetical protein LBN25_04180, partial [Christensenellaceae bacterium]|nr:hypothetical protein [Christensenellaceae bacterium]
MQTLLIMLVVALSSAMLFFALSLSNFFYAINIADANRVAQGADILLGGNNGGETFSKTRAELALRPYENDIDYADYFVKMPSIVRVPGGINNAALVEATDLEQYLKKHELKFIKYSEYIERLDTTHIGGVPDGDAAAYSGAYYPAIIGRRFSEKMGLIPGDTIETYLAQYGYFAKLTVFAICEDTDIFASPASITILTDFNTVGNQGNINAVYIHLKDGSKYDEVTASLTEAFPSISVTEGDNRTRVGEIVRNNTLLLTVGIIFVSIALAFIIFTAYLTVADRRVKDLAVFKTAGATPLQTTLILLFEVLITSLIGAIIGAIGGRLLAAVALKVYIPSLVNIITFPFYKYLLAVLISVFLLAAVA